MAKKRRMVRKPRPRLPDIESKASLQEDNGNEGALSLNLEWFEVPFAKTNFDHTEVASKSGPDQELCRVEANTDKDWLTPKKTGHGKLLKTRSANVEDGHTRGNAFSALHYHESSLEIDYV
uniref:Uncharacterized protein n=1 Tax=Cannabis sativa TaxID=3483 RepID=A0A803QJY3_CANSA